ncbi:MAG: hypothetical protein GXP55_19570, partial [Deltaproteobacteria bacterium]|nr:hypothetical protein [Deltaproteobacteria bacterium]
MSEGPNPLPDELEQAFAEARRAQPSAAQLEQLRGALGPTLDAPMTGPRATKIASARALGVKLGLGGLLVLLLGLGLHWSTPAATPSAWSAPTRADARAEAGSAAGSELRTPAPTPANAPIRDVPPPTTPASRAPAR